MNWRLVTWGTFVSCLFVVFLATSYRFVRSGSDDILKSEANIAIASGKQSSVKQLSRNPCDHAESITVKVLLGDSWGSGTLVGNEETSSQEVRYTVLTNDHLLRNDRNQIQIETPDGQRHLALVSRSFSTSRSGNYDLAILQFDSFNSYQLARIAPGKSLAEGREVFAAGFPNNLDLTSTKGFVCEEFRGEVSRILDRPMKEGYQIGYDIDVAKGMSGGPLLNSQGEVVGINGKHSDPVIFQNPDLYQYEDGSRVEEPLELLINSSWAIPIETFARQARQDLPSIAFNFSEASDNFSNRTEPNYSNRAEPNYSSRADPNDQETTTAKSFFPRTCDSNHRLLSENQVEQITSRFTVLVSTSVNGKFILNSGIIFHKENRNSRENQTQRYYVITNDSKADSVEQYKISIPHDSVSKSVNYFKPLPGKDLVVLEFESDREYGVAKFKKTEVIDEKSEIYVSSWGNVDNEYQLTFTNAKINVSNDGKLKYKGKSNDEIRGMTFLDQKGCVVGISENKNQGILINSDFLSQISSENLFREQK